MKSVLRKNIYSYLSKNINRSLTRQAKQSIIYTESKAKNRRINRKRYPNHIFSKHIFSHFYDKKREPRLSFFVTHCILQEHNIENPMCFAFISMFIAQIL